MLLKKKKSTGYGCGAGNPNYLVTAKGAIVTGIDINPEILQIAENKVKELIFSKNMTFKEMGVAELDKFDDSSFDVVCGGLCFSELSVDERRYAMKHIMRLLNIKGRFIQIDEVIPHTIWNKIIFWAIRIPLLIIIYVLFGYCVR